MDSSVHGSKYNLSGQVAKWACGALTWRTLMVSNEENGFRYRIEEVERDHRPIVLEHGKPQATHEAAAGEALRSHDYGKDIARALQAQGAFMRSDVGFVR